MTQSSPALNETIASAVGLGYRVVEDYIRQGRQTAQSIRENRYGPQDMQHDAQELAARVFQYGSEFTALWFEFLGVAMNSPSARGFVDPLETRAAEHSPSDSEAEPDPNVYPNHPTQLRSSQVALCVEAARPTKVTVDLKPHDPKVSFVCHALRAADAMKPRIKEVSVDRGVGTGPVTVTIRVPDDQPEGTYLGAIVDGRTNVPLGIVSLEVLG